MVQPVDHDALVGYPAAEEPAGGWPAEGDMTDLLFAGHMNTAHADDIKANFWTPRSYSTLEASRAYHRYLHSRGHANHDHEEGLI